MALPVFIAPKLHVWLYLCLLHLDYAVGFTCVYGTFTVDRGLLMFITPSCIRFDLSLCLNYKRRCQRIIRDSHSSELYNGFPLPLFPSTAGTLGLFRTADLTDTSILSSDLQYCAKVSDNPFFYLLSSEDSQ